MADRIDLKQFEKGLVTLESIVFADMRIVRNGSALEVKPPKSGIYNKANVRLLLKVLQSNREDTKPITSDPEGLREALSQSQQRMTDIYKWLCDQFEFFTRIERIYRMLYPEDMVCVRGEEGCQEEHVITCYACVKPIRDAKGLS